LDLQAQLMPSVVQRPVSRFVGKPSDDTEFTPLPAVEPTELLEQRQDVAERGSVGWQSGSIMRKRGSHPLTHVSDDPQHGDKSSESEDATLNSPTSAWEPDQDVDGSPSRDPGTKPRRRCRSSAGRCCCAALLLLALAAVTFSITVWVGGDREWRRVIKQPGTRGMYETAQVCAALPHNASAPTTYAGVDVAHEASALVRHCGPCGDCSSTADISILDDTKNTLTKTATRCAMQKFIRGRRGVEACFESNVGFTGGCTKCWVDNVMCTQAACVFTCLRSIILRESNNAGSSGVLNRCLECDEKMCGPAFLTCAGANRRRSGIISDIGRDDKAEVCKKVDEDWDAMSKA